MTHLSNTIQIAALTMTMTLGACAFEEEAMLGSSDQFAWESNGLRLNGLRLNGLRLNGLRLNGLPQASLPENGLDSQINAEFDAWLNDSEDGSMHQDLMVYVVGCALDQGQAASFQSSTGVTWTWEGEVGLAPHWETQTLSESDQRWISSCVLSLVNALGIHVTISQRGPSGSPYGIASGEANGWKDLEGAFFGNLFATEPTLYSCSTNPDYVDTGIGRVCTMTDVFGNSVCDPIEALGSCSAICETETFMVNNKSVTVQKNCVGSDGNTYAEVTSTALNLE